MVGRKARKGQSVASVVLGRSCGSRSRSTPTGYKVVRIELDTKSNPTGEVHDVVSGFLPLGGDESDTIGRPVGILAEPGGTFYLSDDRAGAVYKISLTKEAR